MDANTEILQSLAQTNYRLDLNGAARAVSGLSLDFNGITKSLFGVSANAAFDGSINLLSRELVLSGAAGTYASTPNHPSLQIIGDLSLIVDAALDDWTPLALNTLVNKATSGVNSYQMRMTTAGVVQVVLSVDGTAQVTINGPNLSSLAGGQRQAIWAQVTPDDGAGNRVGRFYTAPTRFGPWQLQTTTTVAGAVPSIFVTAAPLEVGSNNNGASNRLAGKVYAVRIIDEDAAKPWGGRRTGTLPEPLHGGYTWSHSELGSGNMATSHDGQTQYVAWVDETRHLLISKRSLPYGDWGAATDLSVVASTPFPAPYGSSSGNPTDSHNYVTVAVDAAGRVHVSGDMHDDILRYMRTTNPGDLSSWTIPSPAMIGTQETQCTYPHFVICADGTLLFFYRFGQAGQGDWFINRWNHTNQTWSRVTELWRGTGTSPPHSAYPNRIAVDPDSGRIHTMWMWRVGPTPTNGAIDNRDICYAYSDDQGATWRKSDGSAYSLPITQAASEVLFPYPAGVINVRGSGGVTVDLDGRPHGAWNIDDGSAATQLHHVWRDAQGVWHNDQLTSFGPGTGAVTSPKMFGLSNGRLAVVTRQRVGSFIPDQFTPRAYEVTDPDNVAAYELIKNINVLELAVNYDEMALRLFDEWHQAVHPGRADGPEIGDPANLEAQANVGTFSMPAGSLMAAPDFMTRTPGVGTFVDTTSKTWTLNGTAQIT